MTNMPERPRTPSFKKPPVVEVALGVQFKGAVPLRVVDYGKLWDAFRDRFPTFSQQPPLSTTVEVFDGETTYPEDISDPSFPRAPIRLWFSDDDTGGLVQFQADRFVFNWRKRANTPEYPRFSWVHLQFQEHLATLTRVLAELALPLPAVTLCETSYVNHIAAGDGWNSYADLHRIFPTLQVPRLTMGQSTAEEADVRLSFSMTGHSGTRGRLHFRTFPALRELDNTQQIVVNFSARNRPVNATPAGIQEALQDGHDWIVTAFKDVTSSDMHQLWGIEV